MPRSLEAPPGARAAVLAVLLVAHTAAQASRNPQEPANRVANGGFENPAGADAASVLRPAAGAWTTTTGMLELLGPLAGVTASEGERCLALQAGAGARQACATQPGRSHALSLAYAARPGAGAGMLEVRVGGSVLATLEVAAGDGWRHASRTLPSSAGLEVLELRVLAGAVLVDDVHLIPFEAGTAGELVRNGDFEEDPRLPPGGTLETPVYVGWSTGWHYDILAEDLGPAAQGYAGSQAIHLREKRAIAQRFHVVPGEPYALSFAVSPNPADDRERTFTVRFGGALLDTVTVPRGPLEWSVHTYSVASASPRASLELKDLSGGPVGCLLDGVSLVGPVPEPETAGQLALHRRFASGSGIALAPGAMFARGIANLGDLDGDGVTDIAIGSVGDDDGAEDAGAVWIALLNADRSVRASRKISELSGGLVADLQRTDGFGRALTGLGDLDGDGVPDLAVGANEDDTGGYNAGKVYVLFLTRQGTVRAQHEISAQSGDALALVPRAGSQLGSSLAGMGDVDGDGIPDLAIGARYEDSVQVCFMRRDGTVRAATNLSYGLNGFTDSATSSSDFFGMSCANMGDFDGDGVNDLLVGAFGRRIHFQNYVGGQYLLLLRPDGTCKRWYYYGTENLNPRTQTLGAHYDLGTACAGIGDVDGDGVLDLATGAQREGALWGLDREESTNQGAVYVLLLNANGTVKTCQRIGDRAGGLDVRLDHGARWGESLAALGDLDGNGRLDIAVGSRFVLGTGAVYLCELRGAETPAPPALPDGVAKLGCGINPPASLVLLAGHPRIGSTLTFGLDNPLGTQASGSIPLLLGSWTPAGPPPCGRLAAGRGMSAPGAPGELLILPPLGLWTGPPWIRPGTPTPIELTIPARTSLVGKTFFVQGRLLDRTPNAPIPHALTDGFALTLGF
jgi:hypothetical protein